MRPLAIIALIAAVIAGGCSGGPEVVTGTPGAGTYDWCYKFDFQAQGQLGFALDSGFVTSYGIETDSEGWLKASYVYTKEIFPSRVEVKVLRDLDYGSSALIVVNGVGNVFGFDATINDGTLPSGYNDILLSLAHSNNEDPITRPPRDRVNVTINASQPIAIAWIELKGMGASPFPDNPCAAETPTPTEPPQSPTPTLTPTPTATPTGASPTPTPPDNWCYRWDFLTSGGGWTVNRGQYVAGVGYQNLGSGLNPYTADVSISISWGVSALETIAIGATSTDADGSAFRGVYYPATGYSAQNGYTSNTGDYELQFTVNNSQPPAVAVQVSNNLVPGTNTIRYIEINGSGGLPSLTGGIDCSSATPTPTGTGTASTPGTPTGTPTFQPLWSGCISLASDDYGFTSVGALYAVGGGFNQTSSNWKIGRSGLGADKKRKLKLVFSQGRFSGSIRLSDNGSNHTSSKTVSGTTVTVDYTGDSWIPTSTLWIEFTGNNDDLMLDLVCWIDPSPDTPTPRPVTGTPPSRTPLPTPTGSATSYRTPIMFGTPTATGVAGGGGGGTGGTGTPGAGSGTGVPRGSGDAGDVLGAVWDITTGMGNVAGAYMSELSADATGLLSAFTNSKPKPISGLPQCMTRPLDHDICAIYYIMHFTIFEPNTPGALIIPMLLIMINLFIAIRFLRWGWKILRRGEDVTNE